MSGGDNGYSFFLFYPLCHTIPHMSHFLLAKLKVTLTLHCYLDTTASTCIDLSHLAIINVQPLLFLSHIQSSRAGFVCLCVCMCMCVCVFCFPTLSLFLLLQLRGWCTVRWPMVVTAVCVFTCFSDCFFFRLDSPLG